MFTNQKLQKPKKQSLIFVLLVAIAAYYIQQVSAFGGYLLALLTLLMIIIASWTNSYWPTKQKPENPIVFPTFWGLILGLILPFIISEYLI